MSRVLRTTLSFAANLSLTGVTVFVGFVVTPTLLRLLGDERYGAARAGQDWLASLTVFDAALYLGLLPLLAGAQAAEEGARQRQILAAARDAYRRLTVAMVPLGLALAAALPWLTPVDAGLRGELVSGGLIGALAFLLLPLGVYRARLEAAQRGYVLHLLTGVQSIAASLAAVGLAYLGWGIAGQFAAALAGQMLLGLLLTAEARRTPEAIAGQDAARPDDADSAEVAQRLRSQSLHGFVAQLAARLGATLDAILVAGLLEPASVVPFVLSQRLVVFVGGQLLAVGNAAWAALAELHALRKLDRFNQRLIELTRIVSFLGTGVVGPAAVLTPAFVGLWVGEQRYAGAAVVSLAAVNAMLLALFSLWGWAIYGAGYTARMNAIQIPALAVQILAGAAATWWWGLAGPLAGALAALVLRLATVPWLLRSLFGTSLARLWMAAVWPAAVGAPFLAALAWQMREHPPQGWFELFAWLALAPAAYFALGWRVTFPREERAAAWAAIGRVRARLRGE